MPHPVTQIVMWICLAIIVQTLQPAVLPEFTAVLMLIAFKMHTRRFFALMRRSRWILLSLLLVYAFATPGEALWSFPYGPSPTREGLLDGLIQLGRLVCVLAGLSILLTLLTREQMISGLYSLAFPARYLGLSRERIAVRLALTLQYAESAMRDTASDWRTAIKQALQPEECGATHIEIQVRALTRMDALLLLLSGALLLGIGL
jgi:energy-coupling factor transport system permease protein